MYVLVMFLCESRGVSRGRERLDCTTTSKMGITIGNAFRDQSTDTRVAYNILGDYAQHDFLKSFGKGNISSSFPFLKQMQKCFPFSCAITRSDLTIFLLHLDPETKQTMMLFEKTIDFCGMRRIILIHGKHN